MTSPLVFYRTSIIQTPMELSTN